MSSTNASRRWTHVYVGFLKCGCAVSKCVDDPIMASEIARMQRARSREGGWVQRYEAEEANRFPMSFTDSAHTDQCTAGEKR